MNTNPYKPLEQFKAESLARMYIADYRKRQQNRFLLLYGLGVLALCGFVLYAFLAGGR